MPKGPGGSVTSVNVTVLTNQTFYHLGHSMHLHGLGSRRGWGRPRHDEGISPEEVPDEGVKQGHFVFNME